MKRTLLLSLTAVLVVCGTVHAAVVNLVNRNFPDRTTTVTSNLTTLRLSPSQSHLGLRFCS
jgi:hypothetical protein